MTPVKICPNCGHHSAPSESFCPSCDFDLLTVPAQLLQPDSPDSSAQNTPEVENGVAPQTGTISSPFARDVCRLESLENPDLAFEVREGQSVGRGVESDILLSGVPHLPYISRAHARFSRRGAQWFVQYIAQGNFIKVDGEEIHDDTLVALYNGSILTLSLSSFRVILEE